MVHSIYPSVSTGAGKVCPELAGSFATQETTSNKLVGREGGVSTWTDWTGELGLGAAGAQKG